MSDVTVAPRVAAVKVARRWTVTVVYIAVVVTIIVVISVLDLWKG